MKQKQPGSVSGSVWTGYAVTVGILFVASFFPAERLWGINWYGYFGWGVRLIMLGTAAVAPLIFGRWQRLRDDPGTDERSSKLRVFVLAWSILTGLMAAAFYLLRARTHFLGDGYQLLASLQGGVNHKPWEAEAYLLQAWVYDLLGKSGETRAELALQLISGGSGLLLALVTGIVSVHLFRCTEKRLLYAAGVMTGGYTLLFFGYLESYPLFVLAVGIFFQIGLLIALDKVSRWFVIPLLALSISFHIFGVALVPGAVYLLVRNTAIGTRIAGTPFRMKILVTVAVVAAGGAVFVHYYTTSYFFRFTIVPLLSDRYTVEGYTLCSGKHLLDLANHFFQLFPALLVSIITVVPGIGPGALRRSEYLFALLVLLPSAGCVFIFNPGLGMPRDWDLFSFAGVPLVTMFFYALLDARNSLKNYALIGGLSIVLGGLVLTPRVITQAVPNLSIAVFDTYSNLDIIRNGPARFVLLEYLKKDGRLAEKEARELANERFLPYEEWDREGQVLYRRGKILEAEVKFRQAVDYAPCYAYAWANLGACFTNQGLWDSALVCFRIADAQNPFNSRTYNSLGWAYQNLGDLASAEKYYLDALRLWPANFKARGNLRELYSQKGRRDDLVQLLLGLTALDSVPPNYYFEAANRLLSLGEEDAARRICRRALETGSDSSFVEQLKANHPEFKFEPADKQ